MNDNKRMTSHIIHGRKPILDALEDGKDFERIYLRDNLTGEFEKEIRQKCRERDIPLKKVPTIKLDKLTRKRNHQGIVGIGTLVNYLELSMVIPHIYENGENPLLILLDNIQDTRNIGAIARSVEAFGGHGIILSGNNSGMITPDSIKSSAGALTRLMVSRERNTTKALELISNYGINTIGTSLNAVDHVQDYQLKRPLCIVLGSEGKGLHISVEQTCNQLIKIPQSGNMDSLNVSVAAGIILYEIQRQSFNQN